MAAAVLQYGPGPGAYLLPTTVGYDRHDARKIRLPQYSFGLKTGLKQATLGPGPGAYELHGLTRYGEKYSPAYSLAKRTQLKSNDLGPGPGAYAIQNLPVFRGNRAPAYTLGNRWKTLKSSATPGPNEYLGNLKFVKPSSPAYSLGLRTSIFGGKSIGPGPAAYKPDSKCIGRQCPPAYSMTARHQLKTKVVTPGPDYYNLQSYRPGRKGPQFSFGVRHSAFAPPFIVPCDN